jgi:hypothetical protein
MATKKKVTKKSPEHRTLKKGEETEPFFTFRFTQQTVYWLILCALVLALGVWVMYLTIKVQNIYDDIDAANMHSSMTEPLYKKR